MPNISPLDVGAAPQDVRDLYLDFQRRMGFPAPPNFIMTQGHSLSVARGTWGLVQNVLVCGVLPRTLKEMMFVAISQVRECRYCEAAHLACCRMLGLQADLLGTLALRVADIAPPKARDVILFGLKCAAHPRDITQADIARLRAYGMNEAEIVEAIATASLAVYANIIADATGMNADAMFADF
jgi:uncharacterized peroxidase-related enzyme